MQANDEKERPNFSVMGAAFHAQMEVTDFPSDDVTFQGFVENVPKGGKTGRLLMLVQAGDLVTWATYTPPPDEETTLLNDAAHLLETAPIGVSNTVSNPEWRAWVAKRKAWMARYNQ